MQPQARIFQGTCIERMTKLLFSHHYNAVETEAPFIDLSRLQRMPSIPVISFKNAAMEDATGPHWRRLIGSLAKRIFHAFVRPTLIVLNNHDSIKIYIFSFNLGFIRIY